MAEEASPYAGFRGSILKTSVLAFIQAEGQSMFYVRMPAECGFINEPVKP
jgi:hypothetical protein